MRRFGLVLVASFLGCSTGEPVQPRSEARPVTAVDAVRSSSPPAEVEAQVVRVDGQQHFVEADDGHRIAVWEKTPESARGAVVLLHGRTWSGRPDFDLQVVGEQRSTMDALVREGFAAYTVDLRGYGGTARDTSGFNTPDRAARDVAQALDFVESRVDAPESPALLGWSLGSLTTQLVAQRHPEKVSAVILYGYPRRHDHRYKPTADPDAKPARKKTTAEAAAEDFVTPGTMSQGAIAAFVEAALEHDPVKADWRDLDQWNELDPAKLRVPTLLIHGQFDPYAPPKGQAAFFARIRDPDRTYVIVAGGDHAAHLEDTGPRFVQAVVSFLERPRLDAPKKKSRG